MVPQDISYRRLQSLQVADSQFTTPGELVQWLGAVQAQDYTSGKWAIGARLPNITDTDIEQAIAQKQILRTWPMRGTLHFVPARDAKWMLKLMASKIVKADATRRRQLEISDEQLATACRSMIRALEGGKMLQRKELLQAIEAGGVPTSNQRGYHLLAYAAWSGLICLGPMAGKQQTFVLLDEWVPNSVELNSDEALTEIAVRFAQSHGPATVHDLARWTGLTITQARTGLQNGQNRLKTVEINGITHWMQPDLPALSSAVHGTYLLPAFDELILGYKDRSAVLPLDHEVRIVPGGNGVFLPIVVSDGQVIGIWKRTITKKITIEVLLFAAPTPVQKRDITAEAKRFASFMQLPLGEITWTRLHY